MRGRGGGLSIGQSENETREDEAYRCKQTDTGTDKSVFHIVLLRSHTSLLVAVTWALVSWMAANEREVRGSPMDETRAHCSMSGKCRPWSEDTSLAGCLGD